MTVEFAPYGFTPACFGYGEMKPVFRYVVPPFSRDKVSQRISKSVRHHFGIASGAGREIHEHYVVYGERRVSVALVGIGIRLIKTCPTVLFAYYDEVVDARFFCGKLYLARYRSVRSAKNTADPRPLDTVNDVLFLKLVGCGNGDCAYLVKRYDCKPELKVTAEYKQNSVALFDALGFQKVCHLIGH